MNDEWGRSMNASPLDYRKLTAADVPESETIIIEVPAPGGAVRRPRRGRAARRSPPAALSNAIEHVTGVRITQLPLTPERIALALASNGASAEDATSPCSGTDPGL